MSNIKGSSGSDVRAEGSNDLKMALGIQHPP